MQENVRASVRRNIGRVTAIGAGLAVTITMTAGPAQSVAAPAGPAYATNGLLDPVLDPILDPVTDPVTDPDGSTDSEDPSGPAESAIDTILGVSTVANTAIFSFAASPATEGATYLCSLAGPSQTHALKPCESPLQYSDLEPGSYVFSVMALDGGLEDLDPATHAWTVTGLLPQEDTEAPETRLAGKPRNNGWLVRRGTLVRVSADEAATYRCRLNGKAVSPCGSEVALTRLGSRTHVFKAVAIDEAGNTDKTAATKVFTVPRNNKAMKHSAGWKKRNARAHFLNSFSETKRKGAVLQTRARGFRKVALVASTGKGHGTVKVFLGKRLLKKVSLHSQRTRGKRVIAVANFRSKKRGALTVRVTSRGKLVRIEGLGIASR